MKAVEGESGIYYAIAPSGTWQKLIFCRMNPANNTNDWGNKWNQSGNCTWTNANSLLTVGSSWDNFTTTWSVKAVTSKGKLVASSANVSENEAVTLTPSLTTNTEINTILSTEYTISLATGASVSDNTFTATAAGTYTVTATIKYRLNGYTSTSFESTATASTTITVASAAEPKHDVTVTWMSGTTELQPSQTLSVGESTEYPVEAPEFKGYTFSGWELGSGVQSVDATANPISITTKASGDYTLTAKYTEIPKVTVYFVNNSEWTKIQAYAWDGTKGTNPSWPGADITANKLGEQIGGYDVYSYTVEQGSYGKVIFNNGSAQTKDYVWSDGNYYWNNEAKDFKGGTKADAESKFSVPVEYEYVYFINTNSWAAVNIYTWDSEIATWPGVAMNKEAEQIAGFDVYSHKEVKGTSFGGMKFNEGKDKKETGNLTWQAGKYYAPSKDKWYDTKEAAAEALAVPVVTYDYYIVGSLVGGWDPKQKGIEKDGELYKATFTDLAAGEYEFKITKGDWAQQWNYSNLDKAYEEVSEGKDGEGNPNGNIKIVTTAVKTITVNFDATANKISLEGLTPYVAPLTYTVTVPAGTEKCYIAGAMNGWNFQEMTATANANEFTIEIAGARETDEYKYACQADWAYAEVIEGGGNRTAWSALDEVTAWNKPVVYTYYLMGVNDDWATGIEMEVNTDAENEVMITCQPVNGEVKIKRLGDDASEYWYGGKSLKAEEGNLGTNTGTGDEDGNILLEEGIYNFYFNTADGKLWIAAATGCVIEPEYNVVEDYITNFVFDTEAWPMVCMGGPSTTYQVEVFLTLTEDADGTLAYEDCSVSIMGTDATFIDGTLSNIDPYAPYADAVLHVQWDGDYYELQLAMSSTPAEAITIEAEDATVTLTEYPTNFEETEFAYELSMVANWVNEAESLPYTVEFVIPTFDPTAASGEYIANFYVTGEGDAAGMNENVTVTVTKDGNNVTLTGNVSALNGNAYNVTISGTLPVAAPDYTRTVTPGYYGTICLPYGSSYMTGATFFETSHIEGDKVYFNEVTTLKAGHAYIFLARTDKIAIYKEGDETVVTPIAKNGLYGTFDPITDVAAESANDEYIIVYNNTTAQCELSMCGNNCSLEANRAYVVLSEIGTEPVQLMPGCRRIGMSVQGENEATGFENITAPAGKTIKAVVNSQLIIIRDGEMYNAQGVRL